MSDEPTTGCHALPSAPGQPLSSAMVAGQSAPIAVQLPSSAAVAGQPLPSAMVAGQSAPIVGQSPSLAAVAGQPLPSAMVTGQSDPIAGQSPSFGCPALPSFAAVAGQPLPSAPVAGQSASVNFFRYIATVSPQAAELVGANLGSAPSKRWMRALNARERRACDKPKIMENNC